MAGLTSELSQTLVMGRIAKIAMPEPGELIFTIKNNAKNHRLFLSARASLPLMYLTEENKASQREAPAFSMLLRKHIGAAKILSITQLGLERVVCFTFQHFNELGDLSEKKMYVELMGKYSNIIFTDADNTILDAMKRVSGNISSLREVLPGRQYFLPQEIQKKDLLTVSREEFEEILKNKEYPLSKALYMNFAGISALMGEEICHRAGISGETPSTALEPLACDHLYHVVNLLLEDIKEKRFSPCMIYKNGEAFEFSSVDLTIYGGGSFTKKPYTSISRLLFDFYAQREGILLIRQKSSDLRRITSTALERAAKKYDLQLKQLKDAEKKDKFKVYGDLLITYAPSLPPGDKTFVCENYYNNNETITIPLDETKSGKENAKRYYDRYAKLRRTQEALTQEIKKTKGDLDHLSSIQTALELSTDPDSLEQIRQELFDFGYLKKQAGKKTRFRSRPLHYLCMEQYHMYVGKNNYQNEEVTFQIATGNDWWFHAKGTPGSHVIVKAGEGELPDAVFEAAASLAAFYSKSQENDKVEIDYIQRKNLKKVPGAAPGFVIYHTNWSMVADPSLWKESCTPVE